MNNALIIKYIVLNKINSLVNKIFSKKGPFLSHTKKRDLDIYKCPKWQNRLATQNRKNEKKRVVSILLSFPFFLKKFVSIIFFLKFRFT